MITPERHDLHKKTARAYLLKVFQLDTAETVEGLAKMFNIIYEQGYNNCIYEKGINKPIEGFEVP